MKVRGYVVIFEDGSFQFHNGNNSQYFKSNLENGNGYTFEIDVPHYVTELKIDPATIEEVK